MKISIMNYILTAVFFGLLGLVAFASCSEHTDIYDNSARVGNILLSNGQITSVGGYDQAKHNAVGVIFYVKADTVLVVAPEELGNYTYADSIGEIANIANDTRSLSGVENYASMLASDTHSEAVDAMRLYTSPISGWTLPSCGELVALAAAMPIVRQSMAIIDGETFKDEQYFSSSQDGSSSEATQEMYYSVSLNNGYVISTPKNKATLVRPVLRIR